MCQLMIDLSSAHISCSFVYVFSCKYYLLTSWCWQWFPPSGLLLIHRIFWHHATIICLIILSTWYIVSYYVYKQWMCDSGIFYARLWRWRMYGKMWTYRHVSCSVWGSRPLTHLQKLGNVCNKVMLKKTICFTLVLHWISFKDLYVLYHNYILYIQSLCYISHLCVIYHISILYITSSCYISHPYVIYHIFMLYTYYYLVK